MKKFKIISTCASLVLIFALLSFGVYAATNTVTVSISGTVSFQVQDVYVKVAAGLGNVVPNNPTYYYSQPKAGEKNISELKSLGDDYFEDEGSSEQPKNTISYYLYIENLHGMAINLMFDYTWQGSSKYNAQDLSKAGAISVSTQGVTFVPQEQTPPSVSGGVRTDVISNKTASLVFGANESKTLIVTLTMNNDAMIYKITDATFILRAKASLAVISSMN